MNPNMKIFDRTNFMSYDLVVPHSVGTISKVDQRADIDSSTNRTIKFTSSQDNRKKTAGQMARSENNKYSQNAARRNLRKTTNNFYNNNYRKVQLVKIESIQYQEEEMKRRSNTSSQYLYNKINKFSKDFDSVNNYMTGAVKDSTEEQSQIKIHEFVDTSMIDRFPVHRSFISSTANSVDCPQNNKSLSPPFRKNNEASLTTPGCTKENGQDLPVATFNNIGILNSHLNSGSRETSIRIKISSRQGPANQLM